jgi:uncharacterized cupin superfamily protein
MIERAQMETTDHGLEPKDDGWFVLHAGDAQWIRSDKFGVFCKFEGETRFPQVGVNIHVVQPGQPACLYHRESLQEDFFVLSGECILLIEEEEQRLTAGHFVHCPPGTRHVFVGAGDGPCAILMIGARSSEKGLLYPVSDLAGRHGASAEKETSDPRVAYAKTPGFDTYVKSLWPLY